jgi:hypothetical protein
VEALFERIRREQGRLDLLVAAAFGLAYDLRPHGMGRTEGCANHALVRARALSLR